ncbi:putative methyltransferase C3B9.04 [Diplonema papillatum]|nr:putative methyltransferase C3B9.04 [Diplonema papillatum]|eukprot:gene20194-31052_t
MSRADRVLSATVKRRLLLARKAATGVFAVSLGVLGVTAGSSLGRKDNVGTEQDYGRVGFSESDRLETFSSIASGYDDKVGRDEKLMGLNLLRWWLVRQASGAVLEVGCGTGRNSGYYQKNVQLTLTDQSDEMLSVAREKLSKEGVSCNAVRMHAGKLDFPDNTFDAVVDTFGLCSFEDPIAALKEMQRVCKPDGKILLLEHGLGSYTWINRWLADRASNHAKRYGCIWNKPISAIVEESSLQVETARRWHFGTTYYYIGSPKKQAPRQTGTRGIFSLA